MADLQKQSSFIPQQPSKGKVKGKRVRKIYVLNYITYVVFFGTLMVTAGVYFYAWSLDSKISNLSVQLEEEEKKFNDADLARVKTLNTQIDIAKTMLDNHVSVVTILGVIEKHIAAPVQLLDFSYIRSSLIEPPQIALSAEADSFNTVLFQDQVLSDASEISGLELQNVLLETKPVDPEDITQGLSQVVSLNIIATFNKEMINYSGIRPTQLFIDAPKTAQDSVQPSGDVTDGEDFQDAEVNDVDTSSNVESL